MLANRQVKVRLGRLEVFVKQVVSRRSGVLLTLKLGPAIPFIHVKRVADKLGKESL
jgi:hypothetical protein